MPVKGLWLVLIANALFALLTNVLFLFEKISPLKSAYSLWGSLLFGVGIYAIQVVLICYVVPKFLSKSWLKRPFSFKKWYWGAGVGLMIWIVANALVAFWQADTRPLLNSSRSFYRFAAIFFFNSLPGALIEEYLFRVLPVQFAESQRLSRSKTILLFLGVLVFFTATHIPAYLWQYHISLWSLWSPFTMGAAFFFVYYATRNLPFTALFHAFTNQSWMLWGTTHVKDYSFVILVSILWFVLRTRRIKAVL